MTPLNVINICTSGFVFLLFLVVRCPVKYSKELYDGSSAARALLRTATDAFTVYYFLYTVVATLSFTVSYWYGSLLMMVREKLFHRTSSIYIYIDD
jgi:hypothetical protein